jgi:tetratricopeptide (TPR) repeat protein
VLIERTGGNPFFLEESVRALVETDVLVGERGAYRLAKPVGAIQVPATVQAVLAARFDRLDPADKRLLQEAAVIGKDVPSALLAIVSGLPGEQLQEQLARLLAAEFLYETRLFPEPEYTFKHALTHEVAYEGLLHQQRRALHGRVVDALESLAADQAGRRVERLAHHALRGERWEQAVRYAREAGVKAARGAGREAVTYLRQALLALSHLPERRETIEQAIDLWFYLGGTFVVLADLRHASECLAEAERLAEKLQDHRRSARVSALITQCSWLSGELPRAIESGRRALETAEAVEDFPLQVRTNLFLGWTYHLKGDYQHALTCLGRTVDMLKGPLSRATFGVHVLPAVGARTGLAWCLAELGDFAAALQAGEDAVVLAESVEHGPHGNPNLVFARFALAVAHLFRGEVAEATLLLEHALALCERVEVWFVVPLLTAHVGRAHALAGRHADALPYLQRAADCSRHGVRAGEAQSTAWLGECLLALGRRDEAVAAAVRALDVSRAHGALGDEAWAHRLRAEIAAAEPADVSEAEGHYGRALALATELGMRPLAAHCHLGLGRLFDGAGDRARASVHLATAMTAYGEMQMERWRRQAAAAIEARERSRGIPAR